MTETAEELRSGRGLRQRWHEDDSGCWLWQYATGRHGYGLMTVVVDGRKTSQQAHRWVYERLVGPVPEGLDLDHLCRVKACVNPEHLEPVAHAENVHRGDRAKLTWDEVRAMRKARREGLSEREIVEQFGVPQATVNHILLGRTWVEYRPSGTPTNAR